MAESVSSTIRFYENCTLLEIELLSRWRSLSSEQKREAIKKMKARPDLKEFGDAFEAHYLASEARRAAETA
jgi:hypothetical protein